VGIDTVRGAQDFPTGNLTGSCKLQLFQRSACTPSADIGNGISAVNDARLINNQLDRAVVCFDTALQEATTAVRIDYETLANTVVQRRNWLIAINPVSWERGRPVG
jgi:hypothetical protein